jgi:hypothetical protein
LLLAFCFYVVIPSEAAFSADEGPAVAFALAFVAPGSSARHLASPFRFYVVIPNRVFCGRFEACLSADRDLLLIYCFCRRF